MTEQTTYPTPAQDAVAVAKEKHDALFQSFRANRARELADLSKDEVVTLALEWVDVARSTLSKAKAVDDIIDGEWLQTDVAKAFNAVKREAVKERNILAAIERAKDEEPLQRLQQQMAEAVMSAPYDVSRLMGHAASLRKHMRIASHWETVGQHIGDDMSPVEALETYRQYLMNDFAESTYRHRALSRSSSITANLAEDLDCEADAAWFAETKRFNW